MKKASGNDCVRALAALIFGTGFSLTLAAATWYAKPEATGTGDGLSWANATTLASAVSAAGAAGGGDVYVAKGVHYPAATLQIQNGVNLYGGFLGDGSDTFETRDPAENETIVCGDTDKNDTWILYHPATGTSEKLSSVPVIQDGKINLPTFADNYETCCANLDRYSSNVKQFVNVAESATATIDGIAFVGAGHCQSGYPGLYVNKSAVVTVSACRFVGCHGTYATVYVVTGGKLTFTDSSIEFCYSDKTGVIDSPVNSTLTISGCRFIGNVRTASISDSNGSAVLTLDRGTTLKNSYFSRNYNRHSYAGNTKESVCLSSYSYANEGIEASGCTFVFNSCYDTTGTMTPIVHWGVGGTPIRNCTIASNRVVVASAAATVTAASAFASSAAYVAGDGLAIFDNELTVNATAATVVDAAAIMANRTVQCDLTLLNSTVEDNIVSVTAPDGCDTAMTRGVLVRPTASYESRHSLALYNCSFMGKTAGPDVLYANTDATAGGCAAMNCIFGATGAAEATPRVVNASSAAPVKVGCAVLVGQATFGANVEVTDLLADDPLVQDLAVVTEGYIPVRQLGAAVPDVRTTADVCLGARQARRVYWYRLPGSSTWVLPSHYDQESSAPATYTSTMIGDALGATRTAGSFTRGASQTLTTLAETGMTVVLQPDPATVGYVEGGNTHVLPADNATEALKAVCTNSSYAFHSWRTTDGTIVSKANPFVWMAPGQGTTKLVARFNPTDIVYTFDLGEHGTFDVCGLSVTNVVFATDDPVVVPAFTAKSGSIFRRWSPALPETVGDGDATFAAEFVTRVTTVPTDGDLADALAGAALYPGEAEVRLASGEHALTASVWMPKNVTLTGEDGAILKGASKQNWAIDGENVADATATCRVSNVTFAGAGVRTGNHVSLFTDCVFTNATAGGAFAALLACTNVTATGCTFTDNAHVFSALRKNYVCTFTDCSFVGNRNGNTSMYYAGNSYYNNGIITVNDATGYFSNCVFRANVNSKSSGERGLIDAGNYGPVRIVGSRFEDNVVTNGLRMICFGYYADGQYAKDTLFLNNRVVGGCGSVTASALLKIQATGKVLLSGNAFVSNVVDRLETGNKSADAMLVTAQGGLPKFLNCYFEGNRIRASTVGGATVPKAALVCLYGTIGIYDYGCCNNTFYMNDATDGCFNLAANVETGKSNMWRFSNCIFRDLANTKPFVYSESATMGSQVVGCILTPVEDSRIDYVGCADSALRFGRQQVYCGRLVRTVKPWSALRSVAATIDRDRDNHCTWVTIEDARKIALGSTGGYLPNNPPFTPITDMFGVYDGKNICGAYRKIPSGDGLMILVK